MSCFLILICALWIMINWNQYFLMVPMGFLNRRNIKDNESGIWHVFAIVAPALVTVCILVICFFPHLIISRFDNIPCSTPGCSNHLNFFLIDNLALIIATVLIAGTVVFWCRRLRSAIRNGSLPAPIHDKGLQIKLNRAIGAIERPTNYRLPVVRVFHSQFPQCFTKGLLFPRIWISDSIVSEMNEEELQVILAHEHCHVLRYDNLVSHVLTFVSDLCWAHLGCRTLLKGWYERRELFCDNFSARVVASRQKVASTLIKLAEAMMQRKGIHQVIPGAAYYINVFAAKPLIQARVENLLCNPPFSPFNKGGSRGINENPIGSYRRKLWSFAILGLCTIFFAVVVSSFLASSLTYIHCFVEDVFSVHCSAC